MQIFSAVPTRITYDRSKLKKALDTLATWFNITQTSGHANKIPAAVGLLVDLFGYTPHGGKVYRAFRIKEGLPKVGSRVRMKTGLRPIQSWTSSEQKARDFLTYLGNSDNRVVVRLESRALELLDSLWLRKVVKNIKTYLAANPDKELKDSVDNLMKCLGGKRGSLLDEMEVIMQVPDTCIVTVLAVYPKYIRK